MTRLVGERVVLRDLEESDVGERYVRWMNDPEVMAALESRFTRHSRESLLEYLRSIRGASDTLFLAITLRSDARHIGNIKLGPIHAHHRFAEIGLLIGEKDEWGKGYASEAIALLAAHAFESLGVHRLSAGCYASNQGSVKAFLRAGFAIEGIARDQYLFDGRYVDGVRLVLFAPRPA